MTGIVLPINLGTVNSKAVAINSPMAAKGNQFARLLNRRMAMPRRVARRIPPRVVSARPKTIRDYLREAIPGFKDRTALQRPPLKMGKGSQSLPPSGRSLPRIGAREQEIARAVNNAAATHGVPKSVIWSIIRAESGGDPRARSAAGAVGLMQLMPATAAELGVTDLFDISQNVDGGVRYFRQLLDRFGNDTKLALAAYNAGPGAGLHQEHHCNGIAHACCMEVVAAPRFIFVAKLSILGRGCQYGSI